MKKRSVIFSIITFILTLTILSGVNYAKKKPIPAYQLTKAEEIVEYSLTEDTSQENDDCQTCVCVIGKAKLSLSPDMATITACIENFNESLNLSKDQTLETFNKVYNALLELDLEKDKITLNYFNSHPHFDYTGERKLLGYNSKACFSIEVDNIEKIDGCIEILTNNGVSEINDICYSLSNIDEQYNLALSQALENAKAKASQLFGSENYTICGIREENFYSAGSFCRNYGETLSLATIGKVEIEARVNVLFKEI